MNILITGANGYIGQRLIPALLQQGHQLYCCVRNKKRFEEVYQHQAMEVIEADLLEPPPPGLFNPEIEVAYFLIHSMSTAGDFEQREQQTALHFLKALQPTACKQIIYLSGIANEADLSPHLRSRLLVEQTLNAGSIPVTTLRAGIIVGSGSASFEIIRDLVEKLPVMITPQWLNTLCQPIAVRNVIQFLQGVAGNAQCYGHHYDIGGPDVLSYKQMLLEFARVRQLKRFIFTVPVMTPRLSSYWLYFVTSTSYPLAVNLVHSMKIPVVASPNHLHTQLGISLIPYAQAIEMAFQRIGQDMVISSWKDAFASSGTPDAFMEQVQVPVFGCYKDVKWQPLSEGAIDKTLDNVWRIGGQTGWYYANWLWKIRGYMDKLWGGVGLRRGRRSPTEINPGDALDFWRVIVADKPGRRLLLFAEMKLPGEAWLEFKIMRKDNKPHLRQTATFRPQGLRGRLYWYSVLPFHYFIFNGMIRRICGK